MKRLDLIVIFCLLLSFLGGTIKSQNVLVDVYGFDREQSVPYIGLDNRLKVVVEGIMCGDLVLMTNNGWIKNESPEECVFIYNPAYYEDAKISLATIEGRDTVVFKEITLKTKPLPMKLTIGRYVTGFDCINRISKETLLSNKFRMESINTNMSAYSTILSLNVRVQRGEEQMYFREIIEFNSKAVEELQKDLEFIEVGDIVLLEKVLHRYFEGLDVIIDSIQLTIE